MILSKMLITIFLFRVEKLISGSQGIRKTIFKRNTFPCKSSFACGSVSIKIGRDFVVVFVMASSCCI